ncbi:deoxycytidylate deaminase [Pseudoalteromonas sp. T1lg65]|uniref:deoxycytidylate deaminase n=1 Tax=Pseudoalteromonas sp. T1lg65 TaxID=2077101 RepID=UPI003F798C35
MAQSDISNVNKVENAALISWHSMFMGVALLASARSKDSRTRNGACIVTSDKKIVGVGYNGLPRGCNDNDEGYWHDDDTDPLYSRHSYIVHAEVNAILNCTTLPLTGATIYTTQFPCPSCAQSIIQTGIKEVIFLNKKTHHERKISAVEKMFLDADIKLEKLNSMDVQADSLASELREILEK